MPEEDRSRRAPVSASPPGGSPLRVAPPQPGHGSRSPTGLDEEHPRHAAHGPVVDTAILQRELEPHLARRLPVLAALLVLAHTWIQQHLDVSLGKQLLAVGGIGLLLPLLRAVWKVIRADFERDLRVAAVAGARFLLASGTLTLLALLIVVPGTMISSVTVIAAGTPGPVGFRVLAEGHARADASTALPEQEQLEGPAAVRRLLAWTRPLGSAYYVEVEGYQRHSFDLYPWAGARIRVAEDLKRLPSVLVRVPPAVQALLESGRIELHALEGDVRGAKVAEAPTDPTRGAALFGHPLQIPQAFVESWKRQLEAEGIEGRSLARSLSAWERPVTARTARALDVDSVLEATFVSRSGDVRARARLRIGRDPLIDVLLEPEESP